MSESALHLTNGESSRKVMEAAGVVGDILPWRDVVHEGPTPAGLSLDEMSQTRARYIATCGWATQAEALAGFRARDAKLQRFRDYDQLVLWFEHDLYDQLQLLQILAWLAAQPVADTELGLICIDEYLGLLSPDRMAALRGTEERLTEDQLALGTVAWLAYCAPDPSRWEALLRRDTSALPFLARAVVRHLEQFPATGNGLNRTERQLLEAVAAGVHRPGQIFEANQNADGVRFMGDSTFWLYLNSMVESSPPLLRTAHGGSFAFPASYPWPDEFRAQSIALTDTGRDLLRGRGDWLATHDIDVWRGGVHLRPGNIWRWDADAGRLVQTDIQATALVGSARIPACAVRMARSDGRGRGVNRPWRSAGNSGRCRQP